MDTWIGVSVLLSATVALAYASPMQTSQSLRGHAIAGHAIAGHVIYFYNQESRENAAFRLLDVEPGQKLKGALPLNFTIKETLCQETEQQDLQQCDFKDDGMVKSCSASYKKDPPVLVIICDSVTLPPSRTKRSINVRGKSDGNKRRTKKRKCQGGAGCENPVNPGGWAAISNVAEGSTVLHTKRVQNKKKNGNRRQTIGKKCTAGFICKKEYLKLNPGIYSVIHDSVPAAADIKPLRPKRSMNKNSGSDGNRRKPTKPKCKKGDKCEKEPLIVNTGGFSAIAKLPLD